MSGHSKWSTIKHQKAAKDAKKGAVFTKLVNQITIAAREGGSDPVSNFKLRLAMDKAKEAGMPKDNIERAIKKGTGELEGVQIEEKVFEAYGPEGVALVISTITDNSNRTTGEIRSTLTKNGGKLAGSGAVMYQFKKKGLIYIKVEADKKEDAELAAIDAGAEDVNEVESGVLEIKTPPKELKNTKEAMEKVGFRIESAETSLVPQNSISIEDKDKKDKVEELVSALNELDDVTDVATNFD